MSFNLFSWMREGVKQAVILGVNDAVEAIGSTSHSENASDRLRELIHQGAAGNPAVEDATGSAASRKRLGRSLRDTPEAKAA